MKDALDGALVFLEGFVTKGKWMAGESATIADFSILGSVTTCKEFGADFSKYPKLNEWYDRCREFKGFEENVSGAKFLAQRLFSILEGGY
jgi:glutathione S-transferase